MHLKSSNTLRQKVVHPKDKTAKHKISSMVYAVQYSVECSELHIGEITATKQDDC